MDKVYIGIRWIELFGDKKTDMTDQLRRERWEECKHLGRDNGQTEYVEWWSTPREVCLCCEHQDKDWCKFQSLPCTVNPITTFSFNHIGLACMGIGFKSKQLKIKL